ncbi:transcription elongation factor GreA [Candidatus Microgenomates bacterium]|nr:transcription elongation factor GreA [Candidatus Microgenomates bacterium]
MKSDGVLLTHDGRDSLKKELDELKDVKLPEVIARVAKAREDGDLSENSAYQFGKQEQEFLEGRIEELEDILKGATLVAQPKNGKKSIVDVGCKVTLVTSGKKLVYFVVGDWEAKPAEKKISGSSPLGRALLGKKVGEKAEVEAPAGKVVYSVLSIE